MTSTAPVPPVGNVLPPDFRGNDAVYNQLTLTGDANEEYAMMVAKSSWLRQVYIPETLQVAGPSTLSDVDVRGYLRISDPTDPSQASTKRYVDTYYQPLNPTLTAISSYVPTANHFLVADGTTFRSVQPLEARNALGLGSFALLNSLAYSSLTGLPTLGALSSKNTIDLASSDVGVSILPDARIDVAIARRSYVDAQTTTVGVGLTKTGTQVSVNADQSQVTKVGNLEELAVTGTFRQLTRAIDDAITATSGTNTTFFTYASLAAPTLTARNTGVVRTTAATLSISGPPLAGANVTITNPIALHVASGASVFGGTGSFTNRLTASFAEDATSFVTGGITTPGGLSVRRNIWAGGLTLQNETSASGLPTLNLLGAGGAGNSVGINLTPSSQRVGGHAVRLNAVDDGTSGASFSLQVASGSPSATAMEVLRATSTTVNIMSGTESSGLGTGSLTTAGGASVAKNCNVGGLLTAGNLSVPSGSVTYNTVTVSAGTYNVKLTDYFIACNTSGGNVTVVLPPATGNRGKTFKVGKVSDDQNVVLLNTQGSDMIAGISQFILQNAYGTVQVISADSGSWHILSFSPLSHSSGGLFPSSLVTDGTMTITSDTSLVRNMVFENLTIPAGVRLQTAGWRVIVTRTLTLNGTIHFNGGDASGATAGSQGVAAVTTFLGTGLNGAAGRTTSGSGSSAPVAATYRTVGGMGGTARLASTSHKSATGGTTLPVPTLDGGNEIMGSMPSAFTGRLLPTSGSGWVQGGTGGGSGSLVANSAQGTFASGGGGSGGGVCIVAARVITGVGSIQANGGNGGNAVYNSTGGTATPIVTGGAGGGGGLAILLYQREYNSSITVEALPGNFGTDIGTPAVAGIAAERGLAYKIAL